MDLATTPPFFSALRARLGFLGERQAVLGENVANASTPGFVPRDLEPANGLAAARGGRGDAGPAGLAGLARSHAAHIVSTLPQGGTARARPAPDSETTLDGNAVVLEEQMVKIADTRLGFDLALGLYQKGLQMMRLAARRPQ